ncbi:MAG: hypothetical protein J1F32_00080 [Erysipelotrichales bacterium]|nr:hypothetical protein [Erysipelotrichales bacterium]
MELVIECSFRLTTGSFDHHDQIRPYAVLDLFQEVAGTHAEILNIGFQALYNQDIIWVLARNKYIVERAIPVSSNIKVKTWPHPNGRFDFIRDYEIYDEQGNLCIRGTSKWCLVNYKKMRIVPTTYAKIEGDFYHHEAIPGPVDKIPYEKDESFKLVDTHIVQVSDLDHNGHMNNAKYAELLINVLNLKKEEEIISVEFDYLEQLFLHDKIVLCLKRDEKEAILIGEKDHKACFVSRCKWK